MGDDEQHIQKLDVLARNEEQPAVNAGEGVAGQHSQDAGDGQAARAGQASAATPATTTASTSASAPSLDAPSAAVANDNAPVPVDGPYRRSKRLPPAPVKGILKPAPIPQPKFNFRRDVLGYVGESLSPIANAVVQSGASMGAAQHPPTMPSQATQQNGIISPQTSQAPVKGAFWKRLGGAVTAVAANVPVPQVAARTINNIAGSAVIPQSPPAGSSSGSTSRDAAAATSPSPLSPSNGSTISSNATDVSNSSQISIDSVKSVRFTMSNLTVVYPLSAGKPPGTEAETRRRINKEYLTARRDKAGRGWTGEELTRLYDECCRTREEPGITQLRRLLMENPTTPPKVIDLTNQLLTKGQVDVLSDLLSVDFGLKKLILENCGLDDETLKPLIHALLVAGSLPTLSLANNKRIRTKGWKLVALFIRKCPSLRYLDISENLIDKRIADLLVLGIKHFETSSTKPNGKSSPSRVSPGETCLQEELDDLPPAWAAPLLSRHGTASSSTLASLRMESCSLKNPTLDALAHGIRQSDIRHVSLRRNRINNMGAVALAVMIRDYELPVGGEAALATTSILSSSFHPDAEPRPGSPTQNALLRHGSIHPPLTNSVMARLESTQALQGRPSAPSSPPSARNQTSMKSPDVMLHMNGSTDDLNDSIEGIFGPERNRGRVTLTNEREALRHAEMKSRLRQQIDALPRIGNLLTLDIRSNDIRGGVSYLSQVLKRNRTLKVLNLSDNKIDTQGLASIAEALKYNTTLETLDLSNNPCCGPTLDGITALRTAFAYNTSLMRIFLTNTALSSAGAIALAEFLPEVRSLIHLDLTDNLEIDIAGVMALAAAVKLNTTLRCLDLSIPLNDPEYARLSQDILQSCIRNTEMAQVQSTAKGATAPIAAPIFKSELARELKELENGNIMYDVLEQLPESLRDITQSARECMTVISEIIEADETRLKQGEDTEGAEAIKMVLHQAHAVQLQLSEALLNLEDEAAIAVGALNSRMALLIRKATKLYNADIKAVTPGRPSLNADTSGLLSPNTPIRSPASPSRQVPSPSFSITDSDDSDSYSLDDRASSREGRTPPVSPRRPKRPHSLDIRDAIKDATVPMSASLSPKSPVESLSRNLTLEEGEVFRKGAAKVGQDGTQTLLDVLDDDEEGEELKQEILETKVERTRRRSNSTDETPQITSKEVKVDDRPTE